MDNISLDQVRTEERYNFQSIYDSQDDIENVGVLEYVNDSPLSNLKNKCSYFEPNEFKTKFKDIGINNSYFHLNCRSLSKNWENFTDLIDDVHSDTFSLDFIGLSEVFSCDRDLRLRLPGYHNLISRTRSDGGRGGVGLFVKDKINYKIREDLSCFIPHVFESLFIEVISNSKTHK